MIGKINPFSRCPINDASLFVLLLRCSAYRKSERERQILQLGYTLLAGLRILRPVVVQEMTARCIYSGSTAEARLQVAKLGCGWADPSETSARAPALAVSP